MSPAANLERRLTVLDTSSLPISSASSSRSSTSVSFSSPSPTSPPLSPRSQFTALTVRIPLSTTSSSPVLALPTLPTTLTDPSQLRLFWPHHYYGADIDRLTAPIFQEWKQRPFYLAALREANRRHRRCLRCDFDPKYHMPAPLTPPTSITAPTASQRPNTPPVGGKGGAFIECVRAPRKPWYSAGFMKELSRQEHQSKTAKGSEKSTKRQRDDHTEKSEEAEGRQMEGSCEQPMKKTKSVSWEAGEVNTLKAWSGLPPLPMSPTKPDKRLLADSPPLFSLPLSPTPSSSVSSSSKAYLSTSTISMSPSQSSSSTIMPLSPVSVLCGSLGHLLSPLSARNDVRLPIQFQRMSHSPLFRKQRRVLPPVPKMRAL